MNNDTQFITNDKGENTAVIIPLNEYEDLLHQRHLTLEVTDGYKAIMNKMLAEEDNETVEYISFETIKAKFLKG